MFVWWGASLDLNLCRIYIYIERERERDRQRQTDRQKREREIEGFLFGVYINMGVNPKFKHICRVAIKVLAMYLQRNFKIYRDHRNIIGFHKFSMTKHYFTIHGWLISSLCFMAH